MNHLVIAPVLLPLLAGILLLLGRQLDLRLRRAFSLAAVLGQIGLAILLLRAVSAGDILGYALGAWPAPFGIVLVADRLAAWMLLVTALLALFPLLHACQGEDRAGRHFHILYQLQLFGLNGAFLTGDLFNLFVFFEVLLLASYGLVLHGGGRQRTAASLHYVVLNLVGSSLFLIAVGTLYGLFGTLNMADLALKMAAVGPDEVGPARSAGLLLFAVFALKAALPPLHLWLPAAYASTSAPVAALFAIMTKVGAYAILRVSTLIYGEGASDLGGLIESWLLPMALVALLIGLLGALAARGLREQAAYLVIASVGTLLGAFALGSRPGIAAGLYYLPHSTFAAAALFLLAGRIAEARGTAGDHYIPSPAMASAPLLGGLFFVIALLLAGLPPFSGFLGKLLLLRAALDHPAWPWILALVLTGGLFAMIALARAGSLLFFHVLPTTTETTAAGGGSGGFPDPGIQQPSSPLLPLIGLLGLVLLLTVAAAPIHALADATAAQLLQPHLYIHAVLGGRP